MALPKNITTVFVGYVPGVKNLAGKKFESHYHNELESCKYQCRINGGSNNYFYIQERYWHYDRPQGQQIGNVKQTIHFNRELKQDLPPSK